MRLIDADLLKAEYFVPSSSTNNPNYLYVSMKTIDDAPTIDAVEVKHGEWIFVGDSEDPQNGGDMCSVCGEFVWDLYTPDCKWCPYCGAIMDLKEQNDDDCRN